MFRTIPGAIYSTIWYYRKDTDGILTSQDNDPALPEGMNQVSHTFLNIPLCLLREQIPYIPG